MMYPDFLITRFWIKVALCTHGRACAWCCWHRTGSTCRGYGAFGIPQAYRQGRSRCERANRVCWMIVSGPIPVDVQVLHNCPGGDNKLCVNPAHLWLGTALDNKQDAVRKG